MRFARAVLNRPYKFTVILIVANLFVFLLMWQASGMSMAMLGEFPGEVLWAFGAKLNSSIVQQHQWWRFVTPMFIHINLVHLLVNMYSLWILGPYVERLYGSAKFVVLYVLTGIAGVVASFLTLSPSLAVGPGRFLFKDHDVLSAGASGAIFGLVGVLFVFGIKFRNELPEGFKRAFGTGMLPVILINFFIGYLGRGFIDNAAHLGGLMSGALLAIAFDYQRPGERTGITRMWQVLQVICVALIAVSFVKVGQHFRDVSPSEPTQQAAPVVDEQTRKFVSYAKAMTEAQDVFFALIKDRDARNADQAIKALEEAPGLDAKADDLRLDLKTLLTKARTLSSPTGNSNVRDQDAAKAGQLAKEFEVWSKEYREWLRTTGRTYGLVEVTESEESPK